LPEAQQHYSPTAPTSPIVDSLLATQADILSNTHSCAISLLTDANSASTLLVPTCKPPPVCTTFAWKQMPCQSTSAESAEKAERHREVRELYARLRAAKGGC
jgi:hypothetical protein